MVRWVILGWETFVRQQRQGGNLMDMAEVLHPAQRIPTISHARGTNWYI